MRDYESERQAPFESRLRSVHHDRPRVGDMRVLEERPTVNSSDLQPLRKGAISPPPLKRQRTTYDKPSSGTHGPRLKTRQAYPPTDPSAISHSSNGHVGTTMAAKNNRKPDAISVSKSFPAPAAPRRHDNPDTRNISGRRHVSNPRQPSKSASLSKPTCLFCDKSSATSYNPIVACPGCSRLYHDSCRTPPLAPGIDPQLWRCSSCSSGTGKHTKPSLPSGPVPASHSIVRDMFKPRHERPPPRATPSDSLSEATPKTCIDKPMRITSSAAISVQPIKSKNKSGSHKPPEPKSLERTEVPNTPSQRSSQLEIFINKKSSEHIRNAHDSQEHDSAQDDDDELALEDKNHVRERDPSIAPCSTCRKQTVLAKPGDEGVQCSGCRTRSRIAETGKLEIPETPNVDNTTPNAPLLPTSSSGSIGHYPALRLDDNEGGVVSSIQDPPMPEVKPPPTTTGASPLSWADPDGGKILPEMKKVCDDNQSCVLSVDTQVPDALATSPKTLLRQSTPTEATSVADASDQKTIPEDDQVRLKSPSCNSASVPQGDKPPENSTRFAESLDFDNSEEAPKPHDCHTGVPHMPDTLAEDEHLESASTLPVPIDVGTCISPEHSPVKGLPDRTVPASPAREPGPAIPESYVPAKESPSLESNTYINPSQARTGPSEPTKRHTKRHTNRELARIALVNANGAGMTALQINDWLASKFSYLRKGKGAWEKSVKAVLSLQPEFRGEKSAGSPPESRVLYSFADAACRARYEKEYHSYLAPATVQGPPRGRETARKSVPQRHGVETTAQHEDVQNGPPSPIQKIATKAIKSAPSRRPITTHDSFPTSHVGSITSGDDPRFNPFERTTSPRPKVAISDNLETKRETSFRSVYPSDTPPSIETMTAEEKAAKIAEIKARPSRKQFFGSNWRLAHVRIYGRKDIHDESDGAWNPNSTTERPMSGSNTVANDGSENRSLLQVFNLPSNARPFSDGKELAFRDGTLVNGRLPRSRQVYRVGKVFGGELTIN